MKYTTLAALLLIGAASTPAETRPLSPWRAQVSPVTVELRGPIVGTLTATTKNGAFEIPAATPGLYYLRVRELPQLGTTHVAVTWDGGGNVQLKAP